MKALLAIPVAAAVLAGCGGSGDKSAQIADGLGLDASCSATSYEILDEIDHSKARIYDCYRAGDRMCVTRENGITRDSTATVRVLFQGTLAGGKPSCLDG